MSQTEHRILNLTDEKGASCQDAALQWAQMAQNQESKTRFTDSSGHLFTMYCELTERDDKQALEWLKWVDKIVIFMGLFSTATAALLTVTVQDLKQNPQDTSTFYLENIYKLQVAADSNASRLLTPEQPPPFSASNTAILANTFLFMSLFLEIFTGLLAVVIRGHVPRYLLVTESPYAKPHSRARIRETLLARLSASPLDGTLVLLIILSMWFCVTGLSIYLFNTNRAVFGPCFGCAWLCIIVYFLVLRWLKKIVVGSESFDNSVLKRLFKAVVVEDSNLLKFLRATPAFCRSSIVRDPVRKVADLGEEDLHKAVKELLERTWSSHFLSFSEKMWRLVACVNFADAVRLSNLALSILKDIIPQDQRNALRSVEMGQFLRSQGDLTGQPIGLCAQSIVAGIISNVQESNDGWVALAADQLSKSEDVIRGYLERGHDNVLLANLTYIARLIFHSLEENRDMAMATSFILTSLPDFNGRNTLPELQDDFLALWKEIEEAPNDRVPTEIRDNLFNVYSSLTQGTVDASKSPPNPLNSTSPVYETVDENTQMHTNIPRPASHDNPSLATSSPLFLSPDSGHITVDPVDESSPGGIPQAMSHPTTVTVSSDHAPPRSQGASHAKASASTATADTIADTSSRKQSTIVPDPPSEMISTASSTTPATSVSPPHILGTAALVARHDARDLDDRAEMKSLSQIRQLDPSASNNRDPSENPA